MNNITSYFRDTIALSSQQTMEYKDGNFIVISLNELNNKKLEKEAYDFLWKKEMSQDIDLSDGDIGLKPVIIALKTIDTEFKAGQHLEEELEEMTSVLFLPLQINQKGEILLPEYGKTPWIPREYLEPMEDPQLALGNSKRVDEFLESTTFKRNQINSVEDYIEYAKDLFEYVTESKFTDSFINVDEEKIKIDNQLYMFLDTTVYATFHILRLYNHLLENDNFSLYLKLIDKNIEKTRELIDNKNVLKMKNNVGQMNGEYPLSFSQREAINHLDELKKGEILAIKGPPGTGKTTFLQAAVANLYVQNALKGERAPIIVATSTNNKAVTNIIDSFGKIDPIGIDNLEKRWITKVHSFATYFPSKGKIKESKINNYQYTNVFGHFFMEEVESVENKKSSLEKFIYECNSFFGKNFFKISECQTHIQNELIKLNQLRTTFLSEFETMNNIFKEKTYCEYLEELDEHYYSKKSDSQIIEEEMKILKNENIHFKDRMKSWRESYSQLPLYIRLLKTFNKFHHKILNWSFTFMLEEELEFLSRDMVIDEIEKVYQNKIKCNDLLIKKHIENLNEVEQEIKNILNDKKKINEELTVVKNTFSQLMEYLKLDFIEDFEIIIKKYDLSEINDRYLDKIRYIEFWLAVHYYECRWINEKNNNENQKGKTFENVLDCLYHRIAMISPCMVMTLFMLPKQFYAYDGNLKKNYFMYEYIDMLIVDEAGQISPEIAAASFSLSKKAIVVGDDYQIAPVWNTTKGLDISLAISNKVIDCKNDFIKIEENGLNCSGSSLMRVAALSCPFEKNGKGLFLSEHRRCYDEIIQYCNELVYNGKLEPLRGHCEFDGYLPTMGYRQIDVDKSEKIAKSRRNDKEAEVIVEWLIENYDTIVKQYKNISLTDQKKFNPKEIIGIITPFKSQSALIKKKLKLYPNLYKNIEVGTVHTFQGAEKKMIIFSSVYGKSDGCFFIDKNSRLMNVAVSRAKDSFLLFGDQRCLSDDTSMASGLLKFMLKNDI